MTYQITPILAWNIKGCPHPLRPCPNKEIKVNCKQLGQLLNFNRHLAPLLYWLMQCLGKKWLFWFFGKQRPVYVKIPQSCFSVKHATPPPPILVLTCRETLELRPSLQQWMPELVPCRYWDINRNTSKKTDLRICSERMWLRSMYPVSKMMGCSTQASEKCLTSTLLDLVVVSCEPSYLPHDGVFFFISSCKLFWLQWKLISLTLFKWIRKQTPVKKKIPRIERKPKRVRVCFYFTSSIIQSHHLQIGNSSCAESPKAIFKYACV